MPLRILTSPVAAYRESLCDLCVTMVHEFYRIVKKGCRLTREPTLETLRNDGGALPGLGGAERRVAADGEPGWSRYGEFK